MNDPDLRETVPDSGGPAASPEHPARPDRLGQYVLLELLGQGGMGAVYKARHALLDRVVALKVLAPARLADPQAVARFLREIKAVGKLDHPNLVHGADAGQADGRYFLVMDFLEGADLGKLVQQLGPLPVADACELVRQAALGLQHAHEHGLVHRDVKPSNLLLTSGGEVKVLDLGLARLLGEVPLGDELTDTGQYMGTADYMAPEQGFDAHAVDIRADIYSLGCTLYKLLAGRAPFSGPGYGTAIQKMQAHAQIPIPPVREARPEVPEALAAVLGRMLAKLPDERYATPAEAADALGPFVAGCDLPALALAQDATPSISAPAPLADPRPRLPFWKGSDTPRLPAPVPIPRRRRGIILALAAMLVLAGIGLAVWLSRWLAPHTPPGNDAAEELAPGVWHDLLRLQRGPVELQWPFNRRDSRWWRDRTEHQLWVICEGLGLLGLGETTATTYELEMELRQDPWVGNVGVFLGHFVDHSLGEPCHKFQFIELKQEEPPNRPDHYKLLWREFTYQIEDGALRRLLPRTVAVSQAFQVEPGSGRHRLALKVGREGLLDATWDGRGQGMNLPAPPNVRAGKKFRGGFGVGSLGSTTVFHSIRFRFISR